MLSFMIYLYINIFIYRYIIKPLVFVFEPLQLDFELWQSRALMKERQRKGAGIYRPHPQHARTSPYIPHNRLYHYNIANDTGSIYKPVQTSLTALYCIYRYILYII